MALKKSSAKRKIEKTTSKHLINEPVTSKLNGRGYPSQV